MFGVKPELQLIHALLELLDLCMGRVFVFVLSFERRITFVQMNALAGFDPKGFPIIHPGVPFFISSLTPLLFSNPSAASFAHVDLKLV